MKTVKFFLMMILFLSVIVACSSPLTAQPASVSQENAGENKSTEQSISGSFTLYTSESEDKVNEMVADFNTLYPNVKVNVFRSGTGEVIAKIQAEQQVGEIMADVIWFADIDFFNKLSEEGLMLEYRPKGADDVDEIYHYNNNRYHEVRLIFNVVAYNTAAISTPPTSWKDLLKPEFSGKVGMPSALYSGAAFNQVGTFMNMPEFGIEYYEMLNSNNVVVERGNGGVQSKLASGEFVIGQLVDFMARNAKNSGSPVDHIWPSEGALLVPTPIGIISTTKNVDASKAFLDYMYTESAQNLFIKQGYISVLKGVEPPAGTPDLSALKILMPDLNYISANRDNIRSKFEELFGIPQ